MEIARRYGRNKKNLILTVLTVELSLTLCLTFWPIGQKKDAAELYYKDLLTNRHLSRFWRIECNSPFQELQINPQVIVENFYSLVVNFVFKVKQSIAYLVNFSSHFQRKFIISTQVLQVKTIKPYQVYSYNEIIFLFLLQNIYI